VSFPCLWVKKLSIWLLCREEETVVFCGRHTHTLLKPNFTFIFWFVSFFSSCVCTLQGCHSLFVPKNFSPLLALPTKSRILCLDSL
jgi:hypothetical protein